MEDIIEDSDTLQEKVVKLEPSKRVELFHPHYRCGRLPLHQLGNLKLVGTSGLEPEFLRSKRSTLSS